MNEPHPGFWEKIIDDLKDLFKHTPSSFRREDGFICPECKNNKCMLGDVELCDALKCRICGCETNIYEAEYGGI
jgi:hypothetical protein